MRLFIKNLLYFAGPFFILFCIMFIYLNISAKSEFDNYKLSPDVNKLAIGDSHIRSSVNDSLLNNTKNVGLTCESFIYTFYKLKTLLKNNPKIDTVLLGASYHNFSVFYDDWTYSHAILFRYFYTLPLKAKYELLKKINFAKFIYYSVQNGTISLFSEPGKNEWLGAYENGRTNKVITEQSINKGIRIQYYRNEKETGFSNINIRYFLEIVNLCREKNITLIILNTPIYDKYKDKIPMKFRDKYYSLIKDNHLNLIEFDGLSLEPGDFYPDGEHVTESGALLVTNYLKKYLSEGRAAANK